MKYPNFTISQLADAFRDSLTNGDVWNSKEIIRTSSDAHLIRLAKAVAADAISDIEAAEHALYLLQLTETDSELELELSASVRFQLGLEAIASSGDKEAEAYGDFQDRTAARHEQQAAYFINAGFADYGVYV